MRGRIWFMLLAAGLLASIAIAQDVPPLTESAAVARALAHHPLLRAAQAEAEMADARAGMARAEGALQVSASGLAMATTMRGALGVPGAMPQAILLTQDRPSLAVNGTAMLPLYTGGRIPQTIRAASLSASASRAQAALIRTQVAADARRQWAAWREALALLTVAQETVTAQTRNAEVAGQLFDVGKVPRFDLLRAQAALQAARQQARDAEAEVTAARARLAQALGDADTMLPAAPADEPLPSLPADALATALARRPDLLAAGQTIAAAEATTRARKAAYQPQVYAMGMADAAVPADMGKAAGIAVGVVAGVPLVDGGRRKAEVREAEQGIAQARALRDTLELQVRADVAGAEARAGAARGNIETTTAQVKAAEEAFTVAQARYTAGKGIIVELLDAQRMVTEARQSLVTAHARYRATLATLYQAMGIDLIETDTRSAR
jgi:outer membrane protein TolC